MTDIDLAVSELIDKLRTDGKLTVRPSKRCRICRDDSLRPLVNKLISLQLSHPTILDALSGLNECRPVDQRINKDILWRHAHNHFDAQEPTVAVWRRLAVRRALDEGKDYEHHTGSMLTALAYHETIMTKGWEDLIRPTTNVSWELGAKSADKVYEMTRKDAGLQEQAELIAQINRIIMAIQTTVPERYHAPILAALEGRQVELPLEVEEVPQAPAEIAEDDEDDD